ncbi:hypothetical protein RHSP_19756 [Rhizobium freirei PRF 81]|uniref:Uncharacterized protein n=1 Tax=Rhizobium freirei PRF 81 TaxID=363754 RepID=N6UXI0_9HYPH|nr:hypothetical protein RHSP_19756 [Rhizobium freirei PRF 81]
MHSFHPSRPARARTGAAAGSLPQQVVCRRLHRPGPDVHGDARSKSVLSAVLPDGHGRQRLAFRLADRPADDRRRHLFHGQRARAAASLRALQAGAALRPQPCDGGLRNPFLGRGHQPGFRDHRARRLRSRPGTWIGDAHYDDRGAECPASCPSWRRHGDAGFLPLARRPHRRYRLRRHPGLSRAECLRRA